MLPEPMHSEMISLWQTIQQEVSEETAAKQTVQNLVTQQQQTVDQLLQQTAAPGSSQ
jgi:maltose-binding protein MalE